MFGGSIYAKRLAAVAEGVPDVDPLIAELERRGRLPGLEESTVLVEGLAAGFESTGPSTAAARERLESRLRGIKNSLEGAQGRYPELREELLVEQAACEDELERLEA